MTKYSWNRQQPNNRKLNQCIEEAGDLRLPTLNLSALNIINLPILVRTLNDWLRILILNNNEIEQLPPWIGELNNLERLDISCNKLHTLPYQVGKLKKLRELYIEDNQLNSLPPELEILPLTKIKLLGNPDLSLPESLLATGEPSEILRYYYEVSGDMGEPLKELKIITVGRGGAGKTTLIKALAGEVPDPHEPETHSISIRDLPINCNAGEVRARVWDFGGQEILHATHQFFLTERCLYFLVLEPRSGMAQRDAEYWLELIRTQGGKSPVIVVLNKSHGRPWHVDIVKLRRKFPFIEDFISTDALCLENIDILQAKTIDVVENKMPDVWVHFPYHWRTVKNAVARMRDNFILYDTFCRYCASNRVGDPKAQSDLASILHRLGLALYFGKDPRLHDTRVLNPSWVTGGVYAVIRSPSVKERDGQLSVEDMPLALQEAEDEGMINTNDYPPETHYFILELMRAFQLCYASEEEKGTPTRYLVPELLPDYEPEMPEEWDLSPVKLRYHYNLLPPSLLPRFIVRTHALSEGAPHWRYGVVLKHAAASALIRAETDKNEIQVFVTNDDEETRRVLVSMVRQELSYLHTEMKIHPVEELEISGFQDHWISVKSLCEIESPKKTQPQRLPVQPEGTADVNVSKELDKLVPENARVPNRDSIIENIPVRLFVSYAREDEGQLKRLDSMLDILEIHYQLTSWRDTRLIAGENWHEEIQRRIEETDIFLFIASATSITRPYIRNTELRRAEARLKAKELEVLTVKLEPCACDEDPFLGKLQRLAPEFASIAEAPIESKAWEQVRKGLVPVITKIREKKFTYKEKQLK